MTVGQLAEILKGFDSDAHVRIRVRYKDIFNSDESLAVIGDCIDPEDVFETEDENVMITAVEWE